MALDGNLTQKLALSGSLNRTNNLSGALSRANGGGTSDYTQLTNKPSINNVELVGNKTSAQLGLDTIYIGETAPTDPNVNVWIDPSGGVENYIPAPASPATGAFLVFNGTAWVAQTMTAWQGGNY